MANVSNNKNGTLISGSSSADTLKNWGANVTIDAAAGNDTIYNGGDNVSIAGGAGKDSVTNWGANVTLDGGDDADNLINCGDTTTVKGGKGTDSIFNQGANVSIDAGDDADNIQNISSRVIINGGAGNDTIANPSDEVTIAGGADNDSVYNDGSRASIDLGAGKDSIQNSGSKVTIDGNAGIDLINNFGSFVSISGGDDNDSIGNWTGGDYSELDGGAGNDSIYNNGGSYVTINGGAGKDSITNWNENVSIDGGADNDSISNHASNVTIGGNTGNDEIINRADSVTIDGGANDDEISNYANKVSVTGGADNDSLYNEGSNVTLDGGAGNDTITNRGTVYRDSSGVRTTVSPDNVTINGGAGDDVLINTGESNVSLKGGSNVSLNGGAGNDTLIGSANAEIFIYENGGGYDVIKNYSAEDTVKIASGKIGDISVSDTDVIFTIGDGSLTLKNMQGRTVTITDADGNTTTKRYGATAYSAQDAIKNLVKAWSQTFLSDTDKLDESIKLSTQYNGIQDVIDHMVADCRAAGDADTFLRKYCGIILDNDDTGAITGWDAGGVSIKTADEIVDETLPATKVPNYTNFTFTTSQGVDIHISSTGSSLNADGKKVFDGLYSWWADNSIKLIEESYGVSFSDSVSIDVSMVKSASYAGNTTRDTVKINQGNITFEDSGDYNGNGMDRTIAHEFTHVAQNLFMGGQFPQFLMEGLADLTHGIDDRGGKTELLSSIASNADSLSSYLNLNNSGTGSAPYYVAGFMFYRYLARQASFSYDSLTAHAWEDKAYIKGTDSAELITGNGKNQTLAAGKGNDTITSYGENAVFEYTDGDGNDLIYGFDKTSTLLVRGNGHSTTKSGKNIIVTVGDGKITLNGAANLSKVNIVDINSGIIYDNDSAAKITLGANVEVVDASKRTSAIRLTGNALDNTILGGSGKDTLYGADGNDSLVGNAGNDKLYGQNGNDTLWGGKGNDTLKGGDGDDLFIYSAGKDVITDYAEGDKISIGAAISKSSIKGSDATFTIGKNTLTVKDGFGKEIVFIDANDKERTIIGGAYLADNSSSSKSTLGSWRKVGDASERTKAIKLTGNALDNTILGGSGKDTLYGADGNDSLVGNAGNDKLYGQNGEDTLWGGTGNDTLKGGDGADLFIYSAGNDVIADYTTGDKISISAAISKSSVKGSDATFTIGKNTLTVKGGKGKELVFIDATGEERTIIGGAYLANDSSSSKSTLSSWREVGDASERTKAIKLTGNELDNTILGGSGKDTLYGADGDDSLVGNAGNDKLYGQNGDDTLWGGIGNDTLKGGDGADVFIYNAGEGKDVISDFANDDFLQITEDFSATYSKKSKVISFKFVDTDSSLTLKNFTATTFNINGDAYKISGSNFVKK